MSTQTATWNLQVNIRLLNDFCADVETFSYQKLAALKLDRFILQVDHSTQELTVIVRSVPDYHTLRAQLIPDKRLHQLLGLHFEQVHLSLQVQDEPIQQNVRLDSIPLENSANSSDLRDVCSLGARLRRALNVAFQGHIGVLKLYGDQDEAHLKKLWERGRITQLVEKYGIIPFDDSNGEVIKLWKPRHLKEHEKIVIIVD
ncbi:MAG: hypothetical protein BWK79_02735 [Beggiatoa sp. IS2]|nr:MAG: hypothetical protein BWK79_02735 [Beggiatoa sp. IS2]